MAALAAEAGLIDPEPEKETHELKTDAEDVQDSPIMDTESPNKDGNSKNQFEAATGLLGGGYSIKLGLKGGGRESSLLGNSLNLPPKGFRYRKGLLGGSKDEPDVNMKSPTTTAEADSTETAVNGTLKHTESSDDSEKIDLDVDIKTEPNEIKQEDNQDEDVEMEDATTLNSLNSNTKMEADSGLGSSFSSSQKLSEENFSEDETKKEDPSAEDPLAALASAALDHSKENKKTEKPESEHPAKDTWYTVGFIKGTSCDVQSYFLLDEDAEDLTVDNLPKLTNSPIINLEPGTAYKFRVAAINTVGRGEWSEVSRCYLYCYNVSFIFTDVYKSYVILFVY